MGTIETTLHDVMDDGDEKDRFINAKVKADSRGIYISLEGCEDGTGNAETILVELCDGVPRVVVWAKNDQEDPSHIIPMTGVKVKDPQ